MVFGNRAPREVSGTESVQVTGDSSKLCNEELLICVLWKMLFVCLCVCLCVFGTIARGGPGPPHSRCF
jgi:hypothetical protein